MATSSRMQQRGKFRIVCTVKGCPWHSRKFVVNKDEDEREAYLALAHHNHAKHPGVFPRWNPNARAIESQKGVKTHGEQIPAPDPEEGTRPPP